MTEQQLTTYFGTVNMNLSLLLIDDKDYTLAYCPALGLYGHGGNNNDAVKSFKKHLQIFIKLHTQKNTLALKLEALGWKRSDHHAVPPQFTILYYFMPFSFLSEFKDKIR